MNGSDAYESEMKDAYGDRALDRLLAGKVIETDPESAELAALVADIEATYVQAVDPETEAAHVARIVEAAHSQTLEDRGRATEDRGRAVEDRGRLDRGRTKPLRRLRPVALLAKFAAAAIGVSLLGGGLALAGVELPGALGDAFDRLGGKAPEHVESLPNNGGQDADAPPATNEGGSAVSDSVLNYIRSTDDKGCAFGQGVAAIASGGKGGNADACANGSSAAAENKGNNGNQGASDGHANDNPGEPRGSRETGATASEGHSNAPDVPAGSPATGTETSSGAADNAGEPRGGRETGAEASSTAADNAGGNGKGGGKPSFSL